tara:strand:- start:887 stop:1132 length:246 start_codon:yes stop_codon:yes gene_type:complete
MEDQLLKSLLNKFNIKTFEEKFGPGGKKRRWPNKHHIWIEHKDKGETYYGEGITLNCRQAEYLAEQLQKFANKHDGFKEIV